LALTGRFNIFNMEEYISGEYKTQTLIDGKLEETSLTADTRTLLYQETLTSAIKNNYVWHGRTPARGYESPSFGAFALEQLKTGKLERFGSEVSILNIFTWTGIIGCILYFLV